MCEGYLPEKIKLRRRPQGNQPLLPKSQVLIKTGSKVLPKSIKKTKNPLALSVLRQPDHNLRFEHEYEHRYFDIFWTKCSTELSGFFETDVWNRLILQICHEEVYARRAVVAIGAVRRAMEVSQQARHSSYEIVPFENGREQHTVALVEYGKAIRAMKEIPISHKTDQEKLRDALVSTLLITCFESYMGNEKDALSQAEAGVDILLEAYQGPETDSQYNVLQRIKSNCAFLTEDLLTTFARLDFQLIMFKNTNSRRPAGSQQIYIHDYPRVPETFASAREARLYWDLILRRMSQFHALLAQDALPKLDTNGGGCGLMREYFISPDRRKIQVELEVFMKTMDNWYQSFKPVFDRSRLAPGSKEFQGASILMIQYLPLAVSIKPMMSAEANILEIFTDEHLADFTQVVDLARELLEVYDSGSKPGQAVFIFDYNLVTSLFVVGTRCRDPVVRRMAIGLLVKYPRREGLWDSSMAAAVSTKVMNEEEKGMVNGFVPEEARLKVVKNEYLLSEHKAVLSYSKMVEGTSERALMPDVVVRW